MKKAKSCHPGPSKPRSDTTVTRGPGNRWRVDVDSDRAGLVIHAVDAVAGEPERLIRAVIT
jgi:hypothetical protein